MEYAIMGIVFGLCLFIVPLWAYRRGLQDGLGIRQDRPIQPIVPSIPKPFEKAKASVEEDKMMQGMQNLMSYDPFQAPKKEGEA